MTQAIDLIRSALLLVGAVDSNEAPSAPQAQDGLDALNNMLADWSTEQLLLYSSAQFNFPVTSSTLSFSVGPVGTIGVVQTERPSRIVDMFVRSNGLDFPIEQISRADYEAISLKSLVGGYPAMCWYNPTAGNGMVNLWPGASAGQTIYFTAEQMLQQFDTINETFNLPPNYKRAIIYNLAIELAPQYGVEPSATVQRIASVSKRSIKRLNTRVPNMQNEASLLSRHNNTSNLTRILSGN